MRIDRAGQTEPAFRHDAKAQRTEETFGADEHNTLAASRSARGNGFARESKAKAGCLCSGIDCERAKEENLHTRAHTRNAADADDVTAVIQGDPGKLWRRARVFAHALAGLGEAARTEGAVEHPLDARGVLRLFGDDGVGQPDPQLRRERIRRSIERVNAPSVRFGLR